MIFIDILSPGSIHHNTRGIITPLKIWARKILDANINFKFINKFSNISEGDIILIDSKYHRDLWLKKKEKIFEDFSYFRKRYNKIIYLDTADSTGWIEKEIFAHIDQYWKQQVLKNKMQYLKNMYDNRIYTDYYNKKYNIRDNNIYESDAQLDVKDLDKIKLFWNVGLSNYSINSHIYNYAYNYLKFSFLISFKKNNLNPYIIKDNNIFCRFNSNSYNKLINFHRTKIINKINKNYKVNHNKSNRWKYMNELQRSKISISPFGWGEIAYRDFETFISNTILLKPDMDHLMTWPNFFLKNETYLDFSWDFENLNSKIENILINYENYKHIALNAFEIYKKYTFDKNASDIFVEHLVNLIKSN